MYLLLTASIFDEALVVVGAVVVVNDDVCFTQEVSVAWAPTDAAVSPVSSTMARISASCEIRTNLLNILFSK